MRFKLIFISILFFLISGCAATQMAIKHRNLAVQSQMSDTIFLDPVNINKTSVFIQVKNTSDKNLAIRDAIIQQIKAGGYQITPDPAKAYYFLQINILYAGKTESSAADRMLNNGYGGALTGGLIGGGIGANSGASGAVVGAGIGMIAGGIGNAVANTLVENVTFAITVDIQVSVRTTGKVQQKLESNLSQGSSTTIKQTVQTTKQFKRYRTRIVSTANKVNLKYETALPSLQASLSKCIAGIL